MNDDELITQALAILPRRIGETDHLASPSAIRDYLRLLLAELSSDWSFVVSGMDGTASTRRPNPN